MSKPRKTMKRPEPYVFDAGGVYIYPTRDGDTINPYMGPKYFNRTKWCPNGFGLMLVIGRGRAFDYLAWYQAVTSVEVVSSIPDRTNLIGEIRWRPPIYGTCSPAHFRKIELEEIGVFPIDQARLDHFFPHLAEGTSYAIQDISLANGMAITSPNIGPRRWRRPDGRLEVIVYPPPPTISELMGRAA